MANKLTAANFDPKQNYTLDARGETIKITQNGKTAEFTDSDSAQKFIKNSNFTVK